MIDSGFSLEGGGEKQLGQQQQQQPSIRMPNNPIVNKDLEKDFNQMTISCDSAVGDELSEEVAVSGAPNTPNSDPDAWKEYYEPDEDGDVQLHLAIASGFVEVINALIRMAPDPEFLNIQNNQLYAPVHIAVLQNQPGIVRRLVVAGARLDVRDSEGNTPLHLAARRGHLECGEALLKPVAVSEIMDGDIPTTTRMGDPSPSVDIIDLSNGMGEHACHLAAMGGHDNFLRFLCWNNADMNARDGRAGRSALHFAVGARNMAVIHCLIEPRPRGCGINPNLVDWYGRSPYNLALTNSMPEIAQFLASRTGCEVNNVIDSDSSSEGGGDADFNEADEVIHKSNLLLNSTIA